MDSFGRLSVEGRVHRRPVPEMTASKMAGHEQVAKVANDIVLLEAYASEHKDQKDLREWLEAWQTAQAQNAHANPELKGDPLAALAESLAAYIPDAEKWQKERQQQVQ